MLRVAGEESDLNAAISARIRAGQVQVYSGYLLKMQLLAGGLAWISLIWPHLIPHHYHLLIILGWPALFASYLGAKAVEWKENRRMWRYCRPAGSEALSDNRAS
jgi:hypothetical protein